jgi:hypothetical protein
MSIQFARRSVARRKAAAAPFAEKSTTKPDAAERKQALIGDDWSAN